MIYYNLIVDEPTLRAHRIRGHPFTVLLTPQGQIYRTYVGYKTSEELEEGVRALLGLE